MFEVKFIQIKIQTSNIPNIKMTLFGTIFADEDHLDRL